MRYDAGEREIERGGIKKIKTALKEMREYMRKKSEKERFRVFV